MKQVSSLLVVSISLIFIMLSILGCTKSSDDFSQIDTEVVLAKKGSTQVLDIWRFMHMSIKDNHMGCFAITVDKLYNENIKTFDILIEANGHSAKSYLSQSINKVGQAYEVCLPNCDSVEEVVLHLSVKDITGKVLGNYSRYLKGESCDIVLNKSAWNILDVTRISGVSLQDMYNGCFVVTLNDIQAPNIKTCNITGKVNGEVFTSFINQEIRQNNYEICFKEDEKNANRSIHFELHNTKDEQSSMIHWSF